MTKLEFKQQKTGWVATMGSMLRCLEIDRDARVASFLENYELSIVDGDRMLRMHRIEASIRLVEKVFSIRLEMEKELLWCGHFREIGLVFSRGEPKSHSDNSFLLFNRGGWQLLKGSIYVLGRCTKV